MVFVLESGIRYVLAFDLRYVLAFVTESGTVFEKLCELGSVMAFETEFLMALKTHLPLPAPDKYQTPEL